MCTLGGHPAPAPNPLQGRLGPPAAAVDRGWRLRQGSAPHAPGSLWRPAPHAPCALWQRPGRRLPPFIRGVTVPAPGCVPGAVCVYAKCVCSVSIPETHVKGEYVARAAGELGKRGGVNSRANKIAEEPLLERWGEGRGYSGRGAGVAAAGAAAVLPEALLAGAGCNHTQGEGGEKLPCLGGGWY